MRNILSILIFCFPVMCFSQHMMLATDPPSTEINIPTDGLILHLDASNTDSYPGSGTAWEDISGSNYDFTISGATFTSYYFDFDGTNDYASSTSLPKSFLSSTYTLALWVRSSSLSDAAFFGAVDDGSSAVFQLQANNDRFDTNSSYYTRLYTRDDGGQVYSLDFYDTTVYDGNFNLIVMVVRPATPSIDIYVNNVSQSETVDASGTPTTFTPSSWDHSFSIGSRDLRGTQDLHFDCEVSKFYIYNKELTSSEITELWDNTKSEFGY